MSRLNSVDRFGTKMYMHANSIVRHDMVIPNDYGANYSPGKPFSPERWIDVIDIYQTTIISEGMCSARLLSRKAKISRTSAKKAIESFQNESCIPKQKKEGMVVWDLDPLLGSGWYITTSYTSCI